MQPYTAVHEFSRLRLKASDHSQAFQQVIFLPRSFSTQRKKVTLAGLPQVAHMGIHSSAQMPTIELQYRDAFKSGCLSRQANSVPKYLNSCSLDRILMIEAIVGLPKVEVLPETEHKWILRGYNTFAGANSQACYTGMLASSLTIIAICFTVFTADRQVNSWTYAKNCTVLCICQLSGQFTINP